MMDLGMDLSSPEHWDSREGKLRARLPSRLNVGVRDITDLLRRHIKPGDKVFEVGCAPGKYLLWCAIAGQAEVSGIEYAPKSYQQTVNLFRDMNVTADLRNEDFFETSFPSASFDMVYSLGLIEHFTGERLTKIVDKHVDLLKPGGTAVIIIPNYQTWYGTIFKKLDRATYDTHNIEMMSMTALEQLAPYGTSATVYRYGCLTPWILSYGLPRSPLGKLTMYGMNLIGLLQPFNVRALSPWLVLEIKRVSKG
jgi:2-polyprenyl-3-methyl-5-hydroxy-6-metoxy-1,4-benzoquinol methylase